MTAPLRGIPERPSRGTVVQRIGDGVKAHKEAVLDGVPPVVVERITAMAKIGILLMVLGLVAALFIIYLVFTTKGADWKILAVLMLIPLLMVAVGANLISTKATRLALGSLGAIARAVVTKTPPPADGAA